MYPESSTLNPNPGSAITTSEAHPAADDPFAAGGMNPSPETLEPNPPTPDPKPYTRVPNPYILNPNL